MQYRRDKKGNELSVLGYGCMRFTKNGSSVDLDKAEKEVMAAIKAGVNYFDTAYVYAGNEAAVGEILDRNHCSTTIWMNTHRQAWKDCAMQMQKDFRSSSWSLFAEADW